MPSLVATTSALACRLHNVRAHALRSHQYDNVPCLMLYISVFSLDKAVFHFKEEVAFLTDVEQMIKKISVLPKLLIVLETQNIVLH